MVVVVMVVMVLVVVVVRGDGGRHRSCHSGRCGGGGRDGFNSVCGGLGDGRCI